jgi:2-keto-3-deoxy-L-rhamnonate aldolase RhmA
MIKSRVLQMLKDGHYVRVAAITRITDPWLTELVGRLGYDVVWFDLEHRPFGYDKIDPVALACRATGMDLMVRIRKGGYDSPMRALEFGANGILVPHCRSAVEARQWAEWVRFPPNGRRGLDGSGADADYGLADPHEYITHASREIFLVVQIEDREAVDSVEEIAAVDGVDGLFVGPGDLSLSYGTPFEFEHPLLIDAMNRVNCASRKTGKWWGTATGNPEAAQKALDRGARMIVAGVDHTFLLRGFQKASQEYSQLRI